MEISWRTYDYGREGDLSKLNKDRNDPTKQSWARRAADKAHAKIVGQLKDKKLMALRRRLISAARAGDAHEQDKIQQMMRAHEYEDRETGL